MNEAVKHIIEKHKPELPHGLKAAQGWCAALGKLTRDRLISLLLYDPLTGQFAWKVNRAKKGAGEIAGTVGADGYRYIGIDGMSYAEHRLAFLYMTGVVPSDLIDHANLDRGDNRWDNLRRATNRQNQFNTGMRSNNTSGFKGVHWNSRHGRYRANIRIGGKKIHLGQFKSAEEAALAYQKASITHHGSFARLR